MNKVISMFTNNILGTRIISKCTGLKARIINCTIKDRRDMMKAAFDDFKKANDLASSQTVQIIYKPKNIKRKLLRNRRAMRLA